MAGRRTGGIGKGLDALIPTKAGGPSKDTAKKTRTTVKKNQLCRKNLRQNDL